MSQYTTSLGRCRSCGAQVEWVTTVRGKKMPLDPEPSDRTTVAAGEAGNVVIRDEVAHVLGEGRSIEPGEVMRVPHFATCPERTVPDVMVDHRTLDEQAAGAAERDQKFQTVLREAGRSSQPGGKERPPAKTLHDVRVTLLRVRAVIDGLMKDVETIEGRS